jgi:hypothetical protein
VEWTGEIRDGAAAVQRVIDKLSYGTAGSVPPRQDFLSPANPMAYPQTRPSHPPARRHPRAIIKLWKGVNIRLP